MLQGTVKIRDKEYVVKDTLRAAMLFEDLTGEAFSTDTLKKRILYFYCLLLASNEDFEFLPNDFIDLIDEDPSIMVRIGAILSRSSTMGDMLKEENTGKKGKKKV